MTRTAAHCLSCNGETVGLSKPGVMATAAETFSTGMSKSISTYRCAVLVTEGCKVNGTVKDSILFPGVVVEKGATVEAAVVMGGTVIKAGATVKHCIVAENVTVEEGATVGAMPEGGCDIANPGDVATVGSGVRIGKGATVGPKAMVSNDVKDGEEQW